MKICFFLDNPYSLDTRIIKECESLHQLGFDVTVICYWRKGFKEGFSNENGIRVYRLKRGLQHIIKNLRLLKHERDLLRYNKNKLANTILLKDHWLSKIIKLFGAGWKLSSMSLKYAKKSSRYAFRCMLSAKNRVYQTLILLKNGVQNIFTNSKKAIAVMIILAKKATWTFIYGFLFLAHCIVYILHQIAFHPNDKMVNPTEKLSKSTICSRLFLPIQCLALIIEICLLPLAKLGWKFRPYTLMPFIIPKPNNRTFYAEVTNLLYITLSPQLINYLLFGYLIKADVYQANDPPTILPTLLCSSLTKKPFIYDAHELYDESFPKRRAYLLRKFICSMEKYCTQHAYKTITVNQSIAEIMQQRYSLPELPTLLRNVQKYQVAQVSKDSTYIENLARYASDKIKLIYAGKITAGRGIEHVVSALPRFKKDYCLILLGHSDKDYEKYISKLITELRVEDSIIRIPAVPSEQVASICRQADIGLMLTSNITMSYHYGLGNKLFHYIASGIPLIVSNQPEKAKIVQQYNVGWVNDELSEESISKLFQTIVMDKASIRMKKQACLEAAKQLCWEKEVQTYSQHYIDLYEQALFKENVYV